MTVLTRESGWGLRAAAERERRRRRVSIAPRPTPDDLHPKQRTAFETSATEVLYGGAAGAGKSHLMRRAAITWCQWVPGLQVYLFRREFPDLYRNHMAGAGSFRTMLADAELRGEVKIVEGKNQIRFANGSVINLSHCQKSSDVYGYWGAEIHVLMIDELTQWTREMYTTLRSRVRIGGLQVPAWLRGRFPRILCGTNPGQIGHNWVKADFIDLAPPLTCTPMPDEDGGLVRQFIPGRLEDNPSMTENDPKYRGRLLGMDDHALAQAMLYGDWSIAAGSMFDDLWADRYHIVAPFAIPTSWYVDRSFDWGSSKPFSVGWWAESDGPPAILADGTERYYPRGTVFRIAEWYGVERDAAGKPKPDVGLRMLAVDVAKGIRTRERREPWGARVVPGPADPAIYAVENGNSIGADMQGAGVAWVEADKAPGSRKTGWEAIRKRLAYARPDHDGYGEQPALYVFNTCLDSIRTVPTLPRSDRDRDDVNTAAEDHAGDEWRYRVVTPRRRPANYDPTAYATATRRP